MSAQRTVHGSACACARGAKHRMACQRAPPRSISAGSVVRTVRLRSGPGSAQRRCVSGERWNGWRRGAYSLGSGSCALVPCTASAAATQRGVPSARRNTAALGTAAYHTRRDTSRARAMSKWRDGSEAERNSSMHSRQRESSAAVAQPYSRDVAPEAVRVATSNCTCDTTCAARATAERSRRQRRAERCRVRRLAAVAAAHTQTCLHGTPAAAPRARRVTARRTQQIVMHTMAVLVAARKLRRAARAAPTTPSRSPRLRVPCYGVISAAARLALSTHDGHAETDSAPWGGGLG